MSKPFFIIGLPRSRTAWLSAFMTYDGNYCFHEGFNGCKTLEEYKNKIGNHGDSSTGLMLLDVNKVFPERRILIIESDPSDSIEFMEREYGVSDKSWIYYLKERLDKIEGVRIHKDDIDKNLSLIWDYLTEKPYDRLRGEMLKGLNIQTFQKMDISSAQEFLSDIQAA